MLAVFRLNLRRIKKESGRKLSSTCLSCFAYLSSSQVIEALASWISEGLLGVTQVRVPLPVILTEVSRVSNVLAYNFPPKLLVIIVTESGIWILEVNPKRKFESFEIVPETMVRAPLSSTLDTKVTPLISRGSGADIADIGSVICRSEAVPSPSLLYSRDFLFP